MTTRGIDSEIVAALETGRSMPVLLIAAEFEDSVGTDDTLYLWTGEGDLSYGGQIYRGTGTALSFEDIREMLELASAGLSLSLNGVGSSAVNENGDTILDLVYRTEYQNRPFTLSFGLLDGETRSLIGTPFVWFQGFMDVMEPEEDGETCSITLTVENAMIALQRKVERTYTKEDHQARYAGDTFFDQMAELQNMEIQLE